jgi:uncharacterized protein YgfB (UPF0149 family)
MIDYKDIKYKIYKELEEIYEYIKVIMIILWMPLIVLMCLFFILN